MSGRDFNIEIPLVSDSGRDKGAESTDPLFATAVEVPTPGYDGMAAMARAFIEEFALMGWPRDRISRMFTVPTFAGPYAVYRERGADFVEGLIAEVLGPSGGER